MSPHSCWRQRSRAVYPLAPIKANSSPNSSRTSPSSQSPRPHTAWGLVGLVVVTQIAECARAARRRSYCMSAAGTRLKIPALIVGGGPVGLYASSLLSAYGVPSILADRMPRPGAAKQQHHHPRAHLINSRSMELLRELGVEREIRAQTPPLDEWRHFRYCTSLLGPQIAAQDHTSGQEWAALQATAASEMAHLSQPKLEAILRDEAERRAPDVGASILSEYECEAFGQSSDGVVATLRRASGRASNEIISDGKRKQASEDVLRVEAEHVLACDGAHSGIRRTLGLHLRGPPPLQHFKSVYFTCPELAPLLRSMDRCAMLHFCFNRGAVAVLVAHNISEGEWVAQLPFFPGLHEGSELDEAACTSAIAACIGGAHGDGSASAVPFTVRSIGSWAMSAKVAQRLTLGRVHLLGDAAHQFPPAGAFGANTGLQDAHNLCWKIGAAHHGLAGAGLVSQSYDLERRPVGVANARLSVHNYRRGLRVANALGLPSELPHTLAALAAGIKAYSANALPPLPPAARPMGLMAAAQTIGGKALELGRTALIDGLGHNAPHPLGSWRLDSAKRVVESGAALPLLFARHELGFMYPPPEVANGLEPSRDGGAAHQHDSKHLFSLSEAEQELRIEDEHYVPSSAVGARLPHHWLQTEQGVRVSTHDLLHDESKAGAATEEQVEGMAEEEDGKESSGSLDRDHHLMPSLPRAHPPRLTLLLDASAGLHWAEAAARLPAAKKHMRLVAIADGAAGSVFGSVPLPSCVERIVHDPCGGWACKREVDTCGAVLVRPDGHVAWRRESFGAPHDPVSAAAAELRAALAASLAIPPSAFETS